MGNPKDLLSHSNTQEALQTKMIFDLFLNFKKQILQGKVKIFYKCIKPTKEFALDFKTLKIFGIKNHKGKNLDYKFIRNLNVSANLGKGLVINLGKKCKKNKTNFVSIDFSTTKKSVALHFSNKMMLQNKKYKFFYSHAAAIFARSTFPCQDTPFAKVQIEAKIKIENPYTILFSGKLKNKKIIYDKKHKKKMNIFNFENKIPISTYLITLTGGVLASKKFGKKCQVYAEPKIILSKKLSATFKDCSKFVDFYDKNIHKNEWGTMIFVVVPDDFPYGGMENPYNIQISKSVLTNDGSLRNVIAHEIAHFWSGNLVTNRNWEHFWLNEGFTNYLYRKCYQKLFGDAEFKKEIRKSQRRLAAFFKKVNKMDELKKHSKKKSAAMDYLRICLKKKNKEKFTTNNKDKSHLSLWPKIRGTDPYNNFSLIPYEKGFSFLYYLETKFGEKFVFSLLREYFSKFKFKSASTKDFVNLLKEKIAKIKGEKLKYKINKEINFKEWIHGTKNIPFTFNIKSVISTKIKKFMKKIKNVKIGKNAIFKKIMKYNIYYINLILLKITKARKTIATKNKKKFTKIVKFLIKKFFALEKKGLLETSTKSKIIKMKVKFIKSLKAKKIFLIKTLFDFKYYHVTYIKGLLRYLKLKCKVKKVELVNLVKKLKSRLNKLSYLRLMQYLNKK